MDAQKKNAIQMVCAFICTEKAVKKKRLWRRKWLGRRGEQGLCVLQKELEINDKTGFRKLLRMTAEEFEILLGMVGPLITKQDTQMRRAISPKERLAVTIRFLATGEAFNSLSFQYRVGVSTISKIVMETCAALYRVMKEDFLKTPTTEDEWRKIAQDFYSKWQFPHCLGALDGKHIRIQPPAKSGSLYHNYKSSFSVIMMAVVDANYKFIYASVGTQGRVSDAGLFAQSDLRQAMDQGLLNFPPPEPLPGSDIMMPYMLVGDEAYPLRPDLMKPYPFRQMDHSERVLNYRLSRARRVVENAFGILANRLRIFRSTICLEPEKVVKITMASLCIHNFLRERRSEAYTPPAFADWENNDHSLVQGTWRNQGIGSFETVVNHRERNAPSVAKMQRNVLRDYFVSPAGCVPWQDKHI